MLAMEHPTTYDMEALRDYMRSEWTKQAGERLSARLRFLGLDMHQLASMTGVSWQTIRRVELGEVAPRDYLRVAIASSLGCKVSDIWADVDREAVAAAAAYKAAA